MTAQSATKTAPSAAESAAEANPLERLAALLADDMLKVNGLILDRLHSDVPLIQQVARYLIIAGGKRIRPLLTLASARLCGHAGDRPYCLSAAVEFIHTATLLHDDVVDESKQRRGQDSANIVFGNQATVLVGDFLFSRAFQLMVEDGSLEVLRILSEASAIIAQGEVLQLQTANNLETTMEQYNIVIASKTAALFAAACEIGPVMADAGPALQAAMKAYGHNLGMAFQIADDVLDYNPDRVGKAAGDDFREGKMTAPVILALQKADGEERAFWQRTIAEKTQTPEDLCRAQAILARHGSLKAGLGLAEDYAKKAWEALDRAPATPLSPILRDLVAYAIGRAD